MNVLLLNTHSLYNAGDAAIVFAQLRLLRNRLPQASIALTSRTPRLDEAVYEPLGVRVLPPLLPARRIPRGRRSRRELVDALRRSDLVLATGGGYLWSTRRLAPGPVFFQNVLPLLWARRLGKPVIFLPQSFGPARSAAAARLLAASLRGDGVLGIFAREEASRRFLASDLQGGPEPAQVEQCPDAAFALEADPGAGEGPDLDLPRPRLAVSLRTWNFPGAGGAGQRSRLAEAYFAAVVEASRRFIRRSGGSVFVFPQVRGPWTFEDDRGISRRFAAALLETEDRARVRFIDLPDAVLPGEIVRLLGRADAVLATRLHAAILALLAGRAPAVIAYQAKSAGTMDLLGRASACLDIDCLEPGPLSALLDRSLEEGRDPVELRGRVAAVGGEVRTKIDAALARFAAGGRS